jgi:hypothetical protein
MPAKEGVVPDAETQKEIKEIFDAHRKLSEKIEDLQRQRAQAKVDLARKITRRLARGEVEEIEKDNAAWRERDEELTTKLKDAAALLPILDNNKNEFKKAHMDAWKAFLQGELDQLVEEAAAEQKKQAERYVQINRYKAELLNP